MIPLTVDPIVVILTDGQGTPIKSATNVSPDLKVVTTQDPAEFAELAKGRPYGSKFVYYERGVHPTQR